MLTNLLIALVICLLIPPLSVAYNMYVQAQNRRLKNKLDQIRIESAISLIKTRELNHRIIAERYAEQCNKTTAGDLKIEELKLKIRLLQRELGDAEMEFKAADYPDNSEYPNK